MQYFLRLWAVSWKNKTKKRMIIFRSALACKIIMIKCLMRAKWPKRVKRESCRSMKISSVLRKLWTERNSSSNAESNKRNFWRRSSGKDCNKKKGKRKRQKYANISSSSRKHSKKEKNKLTSSNLFLENSSRSSHFM